MIDVISNAKETVFVVHFPIQSGLIVLEVAQGGHDVTLAAHRETFTDVVQDNRFT
jgi:hypothetical protein